MLSYRWDEGGRRTRITHPDGALFGTAYDAPGRPTWLTDPIGSALASFSYDAAGNPNGIGRPGATTGLNFSADGRLLSLSHYIGAPLDVRWTFTHNPAGQIASETRTPGSSPGQADAYAWSGHYAVNRAYTTNGRNQYSGGIGQLRLRRQRQPRFRRQPNLPLRRREPASGELERRRSGLRPARPAGTPFRWPSK